MVSYYTKFDVYVSYICFKRDISDCIVYMGTTIVWEVYTDQNMLI